MALGKNIIQLQEELTYMPMQKLIQLVGDPNSEYGSLPLMEIKNRQELQNASAQAPQSTVADDIISTATTPVGISPPGQTQIANGGISNIPMGMADGGEVEVKKEFPSAFRNIFTPVTDTGNKAVDNTIGMLMNIPDLFVNTFDGVKGTSLKDKINLERGYPELVHENSYQFELENFLGGRFDKYKDRLKKDGVPSKLYQEGGSVYNNPYFGNADPEEVKKLQEQNPNLSTEDAVAIILGIDTADITTRQGFSEGGKTDKELPNKGLEALNKVAPDVVDRMGFYGGGLADIIGKTPTIRPIDRYNIEELAKQNKESAEQALAGLRAKYGDNIPREELYGIAYLFQDQEDYENMLKKYEARDAAELARREKVISGIETIPSDLKKEVTDTNTDSEKKPLTQEEINKLFESTNTSSGILDIAKTREALGLQSKEELEKDKQALLLLGLGSAIGGAKDLSDITRGVLPVAKELTNMDRAMSKENIALFSALNKNTGQDLFNKDTVALKNISQVIKEMDESGEQGSERYNKAVALRDALLRKLDLQGYLTGSQPTLKISSSNVPSVG
tara:strand:+ start:6375 stop:8063 length:1689 start_codon:yes stop_codon:yes gene_type:complete